jgi:hypothetical protein
MGLVLNRIFNFSSTKESKLVERQIVSRFQMGLAIAKEELKQTATTFKPN